MLSRRSLKIGLLVLLFSATGGIIWSFFSRSQPVESVRSNGLLAPDISQLSTDFLHSEFKLGRLVFTVRSRSHSATSAGVESLEEVALVLYSEQGEVSDVVRGASARYDVGTKQIEFSGQVRVRISDGTELQCDRLNADMSREEIRINEDFEFVRGSVRGRAATLLYRLGPRLLELGGGFQLSSGRTHAGGIDAAGQKGIYDVDLLRMSIVGKGFLSRGGYRLEAEEIDLWLTAEESLERLVARQAARFSTEQRVFSGVEIVGAFNAATGELTRFQVFGERRGDAGASRATFRQRTSEGENLLEADRILGLPFAAGAGTPQSLMEEFEAQGNVKFRAPGLRIDDSEAGFVNVEFSTSGKLKEMDFRRDVRLSRTSPSGQHEWLKSSALSLHFDEFELLQRAYAARQVELGAESGPGERRLFCRRSVEVEFQEGSADRATGYEECVLELAGDSQDIVLRAPWLTATFEQEMTNAVAIRGGVSLDIVEGEVLRQTRSDIADLQFEGGSLSQMAQSGNFRFETRADTGKIEILGERAVYVAETETTHVSGEQAATLKFLPDKDPSNNPIVTRAAEISIDQATGRVTALGAVRTFLDTSERSLEILAGRMEIEPDSGWVDYYEDPLVEMESSRIRGRKVRYNAVDGILRVQEDVRSLLQVEEEDGPAEFTIESGQMTLRPTDRSALYEQAVQVNSENFALAAPAVELLFGEADEEKGDSIREVQAWGGVEVSEAGRKASGDRASYFPSEAKILITGETAEIVDKNQGRATGKRLVFYIGQEKLTVEGARKKP